MVQVINNELAIRKKFNYPPYRSLITVKVQGTADRIKREVAVLKKMLESWISEEHASLRPRGAVLHTMILNTTTPIPEALYTVLRSLPPYIAVSTHPESTL
jgi:primosomal protein N'